MTPINVEHELTRFFGSEAVVRLATNGEHIIIAYLEPRKNRLFWSGEAGYATPTGCELAADTLHAWMKKPTYVPRVGRVPCKLEIQVTNIGTMYLKKASPDEKYLVRPNPYSDSFAFVIETDADALFLAELFREIARRIRYGP